ncbi:MAG TPA: hypothetical protein DEB35_10270, partial [Desulfuromonas sp.]|nr:hypothetical protein [Desulfuromonas sp.]
MLGWGKGGFKRVGQIDMHTVSWQGAALGRHLLGQSQVGDGVRTDENLEGMHVGGSGSGCRNLHPRPLGRCDLIQRIAEGGEYVGAGAAGRVE